jgi:hypothetical protein
MWLFLLLVLKPLSQQCLWTGSRHALLDIFQGGWTVRHVKRDPKKLLIQRIVLVVVVIACLTPMLIMFSGGGSSVGGTVKNAPKAAVSAAQLSQEISDQLEGKTTTCTPVKDEESIKLDTGTWDSYGKATMYNTPWSTRCTGDSGEYLCAGNSYVIGYADHEKMTRGQLAGRCDNQAAATSFESCIDWAIGDPAIKAGALNTAVCQNQAAAAAAGAGTATTAPATAPATSGVNTTLAPEANSSTVPSTTKP